MIEKIPYMIINPEIELDINEQGWMAMVEKINEIIDYINLSKDLA